MILQEPMAAAIAAGVALPSVLALYMLKLRRRPVRISSLAFWEPAATDLQANVPLKWLRLSLLLILHLLIAALLSLAIGKPIDTNGSYQGRTVLLALDCSASMQAIEADGQSRFLKAQDRAKQLARKYTDSGGSVALATLGVEAKLMVPPTRRAGVVEDAIAACVATDQTARAAAVLPLLKSLSPASDLNESLLPLLVVVTDAPPREVGELGPAHIIEYVGENLPFVDNLGIVALSVRRDPSDPASISVFVRVMNSSGGVIVAPLAISSGNTVLDRFTLEVPAATPQACGEAATSRRIAFSEGGTLDIRITRTDALAVDNIAYAVVPPPASLHLLLVMPRIGASEARAASGWMVADALSEVAGARLERMDISRYQSLSAVDLSTFDVVVFDGVSPSASPPIPTLSLGGALPEPGAMFGPEISLEDQPTFWDRQHPALRSAGLDTLFISRQRTLAESGAGGYSVLARGAKGPLIVARADTPRRVVTAYSVRDTNWPLQPGFAIFLDDSLTFLAASRSSGAIAISTAEPLRLEVAQDGGNIAIRGPASRDIVMSAAETTTGRRQAVFEPLDHIGVYDITGLSVSPARVAVSLLNPAESDLRGVPRSSHSADDRAQRTSTDGRALWPWCVLGAVAALCAEWTLFGWKARR